ncbi:hypothetical protein, partial [Arsenicibacter rosenii]|uniref:hypothetical protein n=1 Tax=Arsenicibacter rosenii TaxID=1750698 RepID=UPI001C4332AF
MYFPYTQKTFYPLSFRSLFLKCSLNKWLVRSLLFCLLLSTGISGFAQSYQPLSVSGFNHDVVANGAQKSQNTTTVDLDDIGSVLYEKGYSCSPLNLNYGLPTNRIINSSLYSGLSYQLADYSTTNALVLRNPATSTGIL